MSDIAIIRTIKGEHILVDAADYTALSRYKWYVSASGYVCSNCKYTDKGLGETKHMHYMLLGLKYGDGNLVDHINGNKLDNRRSNLRSASRPHAASNKRKQVCPNQSYRFKGVTWSKETNKWRAEINTNGRRTILSYHAAEIDAALAYDKAAIKVYGQFAKCNLLNPATLAVISEVLDEVQSAQAKFPPFNTLHEGYSILYEEVTELFDEVKKKQGSVGRPEACRKEAIQVAAMALRLIIDCCNKNSPAYNK